VVTATVVPVFLVILVKDMAGLADLYAVGVVGAIATNLGASATDKKLGLTKGERWLMAFTFLIMLAIEISLFVDKPKARLFALTVLAVGLILRGLAGERAKKKREAELKVTSASVPPIPDLSKTIPIPRPEDPLHSPMLCAVRGVGKTLDFALKEARETSRPLYLLFVREQPAITEQDQQRKWQDDKEASEIFTYAKNQAQGHSVLPCYIVSDSPASMIVEITATIGASRLVLGAPERRSLVNILRGNIIREVADLLPDDIDLLVYA
jgi:nucleotide-binding universal stress UspA family protein